MQISACTRMSHRLRRLHCKRAPIKLFRPSTPNANELISQAAPLEISYFWRDIKKWESGECVFASPPAAIQEAAVRFPALSPSHTVSCNSLWRVPLRYCRTAARDRYSALSSLSSWVCVYATAAYTILCSGDWLQRAYRGRMWPPLSKMRFCCTLPERKLMLSCVVFWSKQCIT